MGVEKKHSWQSGEQRLWIGVLFLLIGVGVLRGAFWIHQDLASFEKTAASASATVIDFKRSRSAGRYRTTTYLARVQFIDLHGNTRRLYSRTGRNWPYERGETVTILYQPDNAESVVIDDWYHYLMRYGTEILLGGFGLLFLAGALSVFIRIFIRVRDASAAKNPE